MATAPGSHGTVDLPVSQKIHSDEDTDKLKAVIGPRLKAARKARDLTQEAAAKLIGISAEFYARIERGNALPSVQTLRKMGVSLQISVDHLIGMVDIRPYAGAPVKPQPAKMSRQMAFVVDRAREDAELSRLLIATLKLCEKKSQQAS